MNAIDTFTWRRRVPRRELVADGRASRENRDDHLETRRTSRRFLDTGAGACRVSARMRRGIEIRTAFAPTRLSAMHLRVAYEVVSPVVERTVTAATEREPAGDRVVARRRKGVKR
jgi:hypothetical protein